MTCSANQLQFVERVNSHLFTIRNVNGHFKVALKRVMQNKIFFFF